METISTTQPTAAYVGREIAALNREYLNGRRITMDETTALIEKLKLASATSADDALALTVSALGFFNPLMVKMRNGEDEAGAEYLATAVQFFLRKAIVTLSEQTNVSLPEVYGVEALKN